jgi:hypothetical protein
MLEIARYNYSCITTNLLSNVVKDVDGLYSNKIVKPFLINQTQDILFDNKAFHWNENWELLKDTFLDSIYQHLGISFNNYKAWVYASFPGTPVTGVQWHTHPNSRFSGVMYLTLPVDEYDQVCYTTEFMEDNRRITMLEPVIGSWFIFDSRRLHRPGYWDYENIKVRRYCLAASVW